MIFWHDRSTQEVVLQEVALSRGKNGFRKGHQLSQSPDVSARSNLPAVLVTWLRHSHRDHSYDWRQMQCSCCCFITFPNFRYSIFKGLWIIVQIQPCNLYYRTYLPNAASMSCFSCWVGISGCPPFKIIVFKCHICIVKLMLHLTRRKKNPNHTHAFWIELQNRRMRFVGEVMGVTHHSQFFPTSKWTNAENLLNWVFFLPQSLP